MWWSCQYRSFVVHEYGLRKRHVAQSLNPRLAERRGAIMRARAGRRINRLLAFDHTKREPFLDHLRVVWRLRRLVAIDREIAVEEQPDVGRTVNDRIHASIPSSTTEGVTACTNTWTLPRPPCSFWTLLFILPRSTTFRTAPFSHGAARAALPWGVATPPPM